jgi:hypothetical protein
MRSVGAYCLVDMDQAQWENLTYNSLLPGSMYVRHWKTPSFLGVIQQ